MKRLLYTLLHTLGAVTVMRFYHRNSLTILLYHGVAPRPDGDGIFNYRGKFITPEAFEYQLKYFKQHYAILELDEAVSRLQEGTLPKNPLVITFDDGYRNFYTHAFPILKKYALPATMFLATDFVLDNKPLWVDRLEYASGQGTLPQVEKIKRDDALRNELKSVPAVEREERLMTIERDAGAPHFTDFAAERAGYAPLTLHEIREMQNVGMHFGAHSMSHPILSRESDTVGDAEIRTSVARLRERLGSISNVFAYPNGQPGDWTEASERSAHAAGNTCALTTVEGVNSRETHAYRLKRITMDATDDGAAFACIASGVRLFIKSLI